MIGVQVEVRARVFASCPRCGRQLSEDVPLNDESLRTGNATQRASYHVDASKLSIEARLRVRGWTDRCGQCRDTDGGELAAQPEGATK